jgi:uncharacterized membrane protein YfhO
VRESANDAMIDVESFGRGFLVMSVTPHKYWRITLDGHPTQPVITNIGYQGVVVPSGRHQIAMRYRNTLVQRGGIVSFAMAIILLIVALFNRPPRPAIVESAL